MANTIQIIVEAVDRTGGGFNAILSKLGLSNEKIEEINNKLPGMAAKFTLVSAAIGAVVKFTKEAIDETVKYGNTMNDLSLATGQSLEDMSRLAVAAERFGVSTKTLASGLETLTKSGGDASIEGLMKIANEYNAISNGAERARMMTKLFGASGPEMAKLFKQGSADILKAMEDVNQALVWDSQKQAQLEGYTRAVTGLKQAFQSLKIAIGSDVIPNLAIMASALAGGNEEFIKSQQEINRLKLEIEKMSGAAAMGSKAAREELAWLILDYQLLTTTTQNNSTALQDNFTKAELAAMGMNNLSTGINNVGVSAEEQSGAIWHLSNGAWSLVSGLNSIPSQIDSYVTVHYSFEGIDSRDAAEFAPYKNMDYLLVGGKKTPYSYDWNTGGGGPGGANGLDFTVPPGYPADSFPFRAQSGERVQVTPKTASVGGDFDYDRLGRVIVESLERSSLVR